MNDQIQISQLWWMDNKMGGYDGYELRPDGALKLLNWDEFIGKSWKREGDRLTFQITSRRTGKMQTSVCTILTETAAEMRIAEEHKFPDNSVLTTETKLEKISHRNFSDEFLGHWDAEDGTYIQVIPQSFYRFQLVFSAGIDQQVEKCFGEIDEDKTMILFEDYDNNKNYAVRYGAKSDTTEFLYCNEKIYKRPVW